MDKKGSSQEAQSLSMYSRGSLAWKQKWIQMLKWAGDITEQNLTAFDGTRRGMKASALSFR